MPPPYRNHIETWISEIFGNISGNITHLSLPKSKLGLNILTFQQIYVEYKLGVRRTLETSLNEDIRNLYKLRSTKNVNSNSTLEKINSTKKHIVKNRSCPLLSTQIRVYLERLSQFERTMRYYQLSCEFDSTHPFGSMAQNDFFVT